jgi:signal transduction histidine kinase/ligand-binding sensor domain-containing protein
MAATLLIAALVGAPAFLGATDLRNVLTDYTLTSWHAGDGLPPGTVFALAQDHDGYLWVGNDSGLFRFDGLRFVLGAELIGSSLPELPVRALHVARDGTLWVGFGGAGGVAQITGVSDEPPQRFAITAAPIETGVVNTIVEESTGAIWVGANTGLYRWTGSGWEPWTAGLSTGPVTAGYVDGRGAVLVAQAGSVYARAANAPAFELIAGSERSDELVRGITESAPARIWMTDSIAGFRVAGGGAMRSLDAGRGVRLLRDRTGALWVGTAGQGLWRVRIVEDGKSPAIEKASGLTGLVGDGVYSLLEDRDGNIWAGTTEGLNRLTPRRITQLVDLGLVNGVEETPDGRIWLGTTRGLIQVERFDRDARELRPMGQARVRALHADRQGTLWAATDTNLLRFAGGRSTVLPLPADPPLNKIESIASDDRDGLWLYDLDVGLHRWRDGRLERIPLPPDLARERVSTMQTDSAGRVWIMFSGGQVAIANGGGLVARYGPADGLDAGPYNSMCEDADGIVWLAGARGLSRFQNGRFATARAGTAFPASNLVAVVLDTERTLWMGGSRGILHIDREEFDRLAADPEYVARYSLYERSDGIAGVALTSGSNRRVVRADDGRLWFVTYRGITIIDPGALRQMRPPGPIRIEAVLADGQKVPLAPSIQLPPRTRSVEIRYTVPDLTSAVKNRFRYRLDGFDPDWNEADTRRQAFYTNLAPKRYRFAVMTSRTGEWAGDGIALDFAIRPMFYQTAWFYVVSALGLVVAVWSAWRMRLRRVRRQFALLLTERARLSREVHDTLLQSLVGTALQLDALANEPDSPLVSRKEYLLRARRQVEEYIREARQAIWDLRSPRLEQGDLVSALQHAGRQATEGKPIAFELSVTGTPRRSSTAVEAQVLRIGQEAILNAVNHGRATQLAVELDYQDSSLALRVVDNGVGFDPAQVGDDSERHYGLHIMKERAGEVGGTLDVSSTPGGGTTVFAAIPTRQAQRMAS